MKKSLLFLISVLLICGINAGVTAYAKTVEYIDYWGNDEFVNVRDDSLTDVEAYFCISACANLQRLDLHALKYVGGLLDLSMNPKLVSLDLSGLEYAGVICFEDCDSITEINLSNLKHIEGIGGSFYGCDKLTTINLGSLCEICVQGYEDMGEPYISFEGCNSLELIYLHEGNPAGIEVPKGVKVEYVEHSFEKGVCSVCDFITGELVKSGDGYVYVSNGELVEYTGLVEYSGFLWYVKNGILDKSFYGLTEGTVGDDIYYIAKGRYNDSYTGLYYSDELAAWIYLNEGKADWEYNGFVYYNKANEWYYVRNGVVDKSVNGLFYYEGSGLYYYVKNGRIDRSVTSLVYNAEDDDWYYIVEGRQYKKGTGLVFYAKSNCYYYVTGGRVDFDYSGEFVAGNKVYNIVKGRMKG